MKLSTNLYWTLEFSKPFLYKGNVSSEEYSSPFFPAVHTDEDEDEEEEEAVKDTEEDQGAELVLSASTFLLSILDQGQGGTREG